MAVHKSVWTVIKQTFSEFLEDDCFQMAGALAYYTVFSLPPLLVLVIIIAGVAFGRQAVEGHLEQEIASLIGSEAAVQVQTMVSNASERLQSGNGLFPTVFGAAALIFGATGAFAQLQKALNRAWEVRPSPERAGILTFLIKRLLSFGMILGTGFLLLVSLMLSAAISAFGNRVQNYLPATPVELPTALDFVLSISVITVLFAAIFRILPDARIKWSDVWTGAGVTAALFVIGKLVIGIYIGRSNPGSMFGAAGSLVLVLLWIYYSSIMLLLGAEFTQVWARRYGKQIQPSKGATRMVRTTHDLDSGENPDPNASSSEQER